MRIDINSPLAHLATKSALFARGMTQGARFRYDGRYLYMIGGMPHHVRYLRIHAGNRIQPAYPESHVRRHGPSRARRRRPVHRRGKRYCAWTPPPVAHRPCERQPAYGARHGRARRRHHVSGAASRWHPVRHARTGRCKGPVRHRVQRRNLQLPRPARRA